MALTSPSLAQRPNRFWSLLHFLIRFLGLTGLLAALVGLFLVSLDGLPTSWNDLWLTAAGGKDPVIGWLLGAGAAVFLFAFVVELLVIVALTAARRSALALNAFVQIILAAALLVGINLWSAADLKFRFLGEDYDFPPHYARIDLTRAREFTLPEGVRQQLQKLQGETTVVIYQRHRTFAGSTDKPDHYDAAAERKVVDKVKDLVEQLRELGQQFHVEVLDSEAEGYYDKLEAISANAPELKKAIEAAPENSLFFYARENGSRVQQLSFNDFLRLDKTASREANNGRGNLVLSKGGVEPIGNRIENLEQRKPIVGILVVHEALTSEGAIEFYTLAGARKALKAHGFEVRDVVLKREKSSPDGRFALEPTVDLLEDSKFDRLVDEQKQIKEELRELDERIKMLTELDKLLSDPKTPLLKINEKLFDFRVQLRNDLGRPQALKLMREELALSQQLRLDSQERDREITQEVSQLDADVVGERRRVTDLKPKLDRILSECDLLLLPRVTTSQDGVPVVQPRIHELDSRLVAAIKDYLKAGKPVLASFGPLNRRTGAPDPSDDLEGLFRELGVRFGKRAIVYDAEKRTFTGEEPNPFRLQTVRLPALELKGSAEQSLAERRDVAVQRKALTPRDLAVLGTCLSAPTTGLLSMAAMAVPDQIALRKRTTNPIRRSLEFTGQCLGSPLQLTLRKPRPVSVAAEVARALPYETSILVTSPATWTDENPFPSDVRPVPRFERPTGYDPDAGTIDEKRQGPFTVAAACETTVPKNWLNSAADRQEKVRLVAIGHGGVFVGKDLPLAQERLLLDSCNWLLGREKDRLARPAPEWQYPRVDLSPKAQTIWLWACRLGMPLVFAYLGLVALLIRRLR